MSASNTSESASKEAQQEVTGSDAALADNVMLPATVVAGESESESHELELESPAEIIVNYRPFTEFETWMSRRLKDESKGKRKYATVIATPFFVLSIGFLLLVLTGLIDTKIIIDIIRALMGVRGLTPESVTAHLALHNLMALVQFFLCTGGVATLAAAVYYSKPTHLRLTKDGMQLLYKHKIMRTPIFWRQTNNLPWSDITSLRLKEKAGSTSTLDHEMAIQCGSEHPLKLRLGAIPTIEERDRVLTALQMYAPTVPREAKLVQALEAPPDHSYLEVWLQALSAPPKRERLQPLHEGAMLEDGSFKVVSQLGVGGQGTAYLALDRNGCKVVLKEFILPVYVDVTVLRQSLEKFEHEARMLQRLDHDQVVKLREVFVEDHRGYLVLEHIDGMSLRQKVEQSGAVSQEEAIGLAKQMCTILDYLHSMEPPVVHRDFTPDNLILRKDGTLKLVDFNVAQQKDVTATGTVVGKHAYLPPEQFRGHPTTQSDIYAMGASLYYILTAEDPEPISVAHPKRVVENLSQQLDDIIAKATTIDPAVRYATAAQAKADLDELSK